MTITSLTQRLVRLVIALVAVTAAATTAVNAQQGATYEIVSSFDGGFSPGILFSSLRQADDGTFYGTTRLGGRFNQGVLFQLDAAGVFTTLHHFAGANDGGGPFGLVKALDGRFYGMTQGSHPTTPGGAFGDRTIFRFTPGSALTTLHVFSGTDARPIDLFAATDGNVYGLTAAGGDFGNGTIFVIDPGGGVRTIHSFPLSAGTGMSSLIKGGDGRFFVTAGGGGGGGFGTIFTIDDAGTVTILHSFAGQGDGEGPRGLMQRRDGRLFGTTRGDVFDGLGTVYSIGPTGDDYRVLRTIFTGDPARGSFLPDLLEASDGNLYGVDSASLFRIDSSGTLTFLRGLVYPGTSAPGELIQGADGRLYGTLELTIYTHNANGTHTTLYRVTGGEEGEGRPNGVIQARDGQFYGTTGRAPVPFNVPTGTVFRMDDAGARTTLYAFQTGGTPTSNLFEDADGSLYGTTFASPGSSPGQIFKISPAGDFTSLAGLHGLRAGVVRARDGRLYFTGTGGATGAGSVSRIEANGAVTVLHNFNVSDGVSPVAELVEIDDGTLYGTTSSDIGIHGTIFRVDPATASVTTVYRFGPEPDGSTPLGRLIQATDGLIYGTTSAGGTFGLGTVFSIDMASTLTTLHHFSSADGANPNAGVIQGLDGRLYGTTANHGAFGYGTVFVINVTGGLTTLHHFALSDGGNPVNELIQASDGAFYGAAPTGGPGGDGVIFRIRLATSPPDQYVEIVSRHSGQCLDVYGRSTDAAASVIQWTCHGGLNQQWRLEPAGGAAFRIIARHSGQALDVYGALLDDVVPIIQWPVHGGDNQAWTLEPASDGYVRIVARHSGKAMDVEYASTDDGARVIQYLPHGGANQQWLLRAVP